MKSKYGWEICDEVQRFISNTADVAFVQRCEYDKLLEANKVMREALEKATHEIWIDHHEDARAPIAYTTLEKALAECERIMGEK